MSCTHLTLTSVVFELDRKQKDKTLMVYLTLTSVVFEYIIYSKLKCIFGIFNFNKCCI